jgi:peptidoglycan/LPS O-acetylase OafA/YrhL
MSTQHKLEKIGYIAEIDGLRAIAVTAVILFHLEPSMLPNGHLGVDLFFTISGYIMTAIILRNFNQENFFLKAFYINRIRRIIPPLFAVIIIITPISCFILFSDQLQVFFSAIACSVTFTTNFCYMTQTGYFAPNAAEDPLIHLWTLAIEEQFYIIYPIIFLTLIRYKIKWTLRFLILLTITSIAYGLLSSTDKSILFYNPLARVWELTAGGILAAYQNNSNKSESKANYCYEFLAIFSLALLIFTLTASSDNHHFPHYTNFIIVSCTCLLIYSAPNSHLISKGLNFKPINFLGKISYSTYLWHQPIIALTAISLIDLNNSSLKFLLIFPIIIIGIMSRRYIEQPFRTIKFNKIYLLGILVVGGSLLVIGIMGNLTRGFQSLLVRELPPSLENSFWGIPEKSSLSCRITKIKDACILGAELNAATGIRRIGLFGDSQSHQFRYTFDQIGRELGFEVVHIGLGGCPPVQGIYSLDAPTTAEKCRTLVTQQLITAKELQLTDVFLIANWSLYTDGGYTASSKVFHLNTSESGARSLSDSRRALKQGLRNTIDLYARHGIQVHIITQPPRQLYNVRHIYERWYSESGSSTIEKLQLFSIDKDMHDRHQYFVRKNIFSQSNLGVADLVDLDSVYCDSSKCLIGSAEISFYGDDDHLSPAGAHRSRPLLLKKLAR